MTTTIQIPAPATVVIQCAYSACLKLFKVKQVSEHFILPCALTAFVSTPGLLGLCILLEGKAIDRSSTELVIYCDDSSTTKSGEGRNIRSTALLVKQLIEDLQQQGYIK